jgi:hypothetical protein
LTHISRRYASRQILAEASPIFPQTVVVKDFDRFRIVRGEGEGLQDVTVEEVMAAEGGEE